MKIYAQSFVALGLLLAVAGCGNNSAPISPLVQPNNGLPSGVPFQTGLGFTGSCPAGVTGDFNTNCALCFHGRPINVGGQTVCRFREEVVAQPYLPNGLPIPVLSPNDPSGPEAWPVYQASSGQTARYPITLQAGFHLTFAGSGNWDFATTGAWSGGACRSNDFMGRRGGAQSQVQLNPENGLPEELYGSDGVEAFPLGEAMSEQVVANNGVLRIGFNVPSGGITHGCFVTNNLRFTISGCVNSAWVVVPCR